MKLNTEHKNYDEALEIIATLPFLPDRVSIDDLAEDFGRSRTEMTQALLSMKAEGWPVTVRVDRAAIKKIKMKEREALVERINDYWDSVYPPKRKAARRTQGA